MAQGDGKGEKKSKKKSKKSSDSSSETAGQSTAKTDFKSIAAASSRKQSLAGSSKRRQSVANLDRRQSVAAQNRRQSVAAPNRRQSVAAPNRRQSVAAPDRRQSVADPSRRQSVAALNRRQSIGGPGDRRKSSVFDKNQGRNTLMKFAGKKQKADNEGSSIGTEEDAEIFKRLFSAEQRKTLKKPMQYHRHHDEDHVHHHKRCKKLRDCGNKHQLFFFGTILLVIALALEVAALVTPAWVNLKPVFDKKVEYGIFVVHEGCKHCGDIVFENIAVVQGLSMMSVMLLSVTIILSLIVWSVPSSRFCFGNIAGMTTLGSVFFGTSALMAWAAKVRKYFYKYFIPIDSFVTNDLLGYSYALFFVATFLNAVGGMFIFAASHWEIPCMCKKIKRQVRYV